MNLRERIKNSKLLIFRILKYLYYTFDRFSLPIPRFFARPVWLIFNLLRWIIYWIYSTFWVTPLFRGMCKKVGKNFKAGTFTPYVIGNGYVYIGDNVRIYGRINIFFGGIKKEIPEIYIGDNCTIGHNTVFDISGKLEIGEHCLIADQTRIQDCSGHSTDAEERRLRKQPSPEDVKKVKIGNNVWVGTDCYILPGTTIGDDCVIAAKTIVGRRIPSNHLVTASPSKAIKIRNISKMK